MPRPAKRRSRATLRTSAPPKSHGPLAKTGRVVRILNCIPSRDVEKDWRFEHAVAAGLVAAAPPVPQAKDLRESWWEIGDQGATGSCVGWALADSVLRWHFVKANRLRQAERLSPRYIWMASKETDEFVGRPTTFVERDGTSLKAALDVARRYGVVLDNILPFASGNLYQDETEVFYAIAAQRKIASYINLGRNQEGWRRWIATKGPIFTRLDCDSVWMNAGSTGGRLEVYDTASANGGHAVAMVGYDASMFIIRNSWGTADWGDKGFGYASNGYAAGAFTEAYGVNLA
jgi:Papain family cysteine protease